MPRQAGPSRGLKHQISLLLSDDGLAHAKACAEKERVPMAEAIRRAIDLRYITICLSNPTDSTMQSSDEGVQP